MSTPQTPVPYADEVTAAYEDALDDVHTRFILNLPPEELSTADRIFFQLEQAWWFYDDFICDNSEYPLPRFKNVRSFSIKIFEFSEILKPLQPKFAEMWAKFSAYKRQISTYGTILLDESCTKVILCRVWKGDTWTFPAGKVNQHERGIEAAARETYEETGFDPNCLLGTTRQMRDQAEANGDSLPWKALEDGDKLVFMDGGKRRTCFVCKGVPEHFDFAPVARKEISEVEWYELDSIPKKSFAVLPFVNQLRRWIRQNSRSKTPNKKKNKKDKQQHSESAKKTGTPGNKRSGSSKKPRSRTNSRGKVREGDALTETGLAIAGDEKGWTEDAMFKVAENMIGRKVEYDGNPHVFAEEGFGVGQDPHAYHVVGGTFMNSGVSKLAPAPDQSKLQPLFRQEVETKTTKEGFQPFFSNEGETSWGDVVADAVAEDAAVAEAERKSTQRRGKEKGRKKDQQEAPANVDSGAALLNMLTGGRSADKEENTILVAAGDNLDILFMTDKEITAQSQEAKTALKSTPLQKEKVGARKGQGSKESVGARRDRGSKQSKAPEYLKEWVSKLPASHATDRFGDFRFDVDAVMNAMQLEV